MELDELGMNSWFKNQADELCKPDQRIARVTVVDRGWYTVNNEYGEVRAQATGTFMYSAESSSDRPCVGDWVCVNYHDAEKGASIHSILPRKSFLRRKTAGKNIEFQMIAANIDTAFITQSCHYDFNVSRLERYLVMVNEGRVEPLIILTKTDLITEDELNRLISEIRDAGITTRIITLSNVTGKGLSQITDILAARKTYCLMGSSGVGKTTLINRLTGSDSLKTAPLSESGEGRHTTVRRQLIVLDKGAMFIDTPGMREVGIMESEEGMEERFDDISALLSKCRFSNCNHTNEPGCAVQGAIKAGKISRQHYNNYLKLKKESEFHDTSYAEKRKKNKEFKKNVKSGVKHKAKRR